MYIYNIPYKDRYIVYRPLKKLAFIANAALVNYIARSNRQEQIDKSCDAHFFLNKINFFKPDPAVDNLTQPNIGYKPTVAVLCMTTACNFRCIYCYASGGEKKKRTLPLKAALKAIDVVGKNAADTGADVFNIEFHGGGEPTMAWKYLKEIVAYARTRAHPCDISLTSNGYWGARKTDWILANLNKVSLSFDGAADVQDAQRPLADGGASFETVFRTVKEMDKRGFPYGIRLTVTDNSIEALAGNIDFLCRETLCRTYQVEPAFNHGRAERDRTALLLNERFADAFLQAYDIALSHGRHLYYSGARPWVITDRFCMALDRAIVITPDGMLTGCYEISSKDHVLAGDFKIGCVNNRYEFDINKAARVLLVGKMQARRRLCEGCFCYWHCAGDCPSKAIGIRSGSHLHFGRRCELNRMITKQLLLRYIAAGNGVWQGDNSNETYRLEV